MNARILELADQAEYYADGIVDQGGEFHAAYTKKFAELIVKECADIATNRYQRLMDGGKAIKQHFGVE
jgi:hypothetical protein